MLSIFEKCPEREGQVRRCRKLNILEITKKENMKKERDEIT
jgi:hypothetical protein